MVRLAGLGLICLGLVSAGCGGKSDDPPVNAEASPWTPPGWETFDYGSISGSVPVGARRSLLSQDEFLALAKDGINAAQLSERAESAVNKLSTDQLSNHALVIGLDEDGFPNINVQPCFPQAAPIPAKDGGEAAKAYSKMLGTTATASGSVTIEGRDFALLKVAFYPQYDTYQVLFGDKRCASWATLTTDKGDEAPLAVFRAFLAAIRVAN